MEGVTEGHKFLPPVFYGVEMFARLLRVASFLVGLVCCGNPEASLSSSSKQVPASTAPVMTVWQTPYYVGQRALMSGSLGASGDGSRRAPAIAATVRLLTRPSRQATAMVAPRSG